jgi:hypothetical protein
MNDDGTVVLRWVPEESRWLRVSWDDWVKFSGDFEDRVPLQGVRNGDFSFVVCIVDEHKTLFNIIPHRYRLDADGKITPHNFDDLTEEERGQVERLVLLQAPSEKEQARLNELRERQWQSNLPTRAAALALVRDLPGFPISDTTRPVWSFLTAFGIASPDHRRN